MLAVMVNCALMGMSDLADRLFPGYSTTQRLLGVVILEVSGAAPDLADRLFPGYNSQPLCLEIHHKYKNKQSRFLVLYTRIEYC